MAEENMVKKKKIKKPKKWVPPLCNLLGTLILISVILMALPGTIPHLLGYEIFNIVSGSMEPEIPVGSIILVDHTEPVDIEEGDVIAFYMDENTVVAHRVVTNKTVEGLLTTKGDANEEEDLSDILYANVIGRVVCHAPALGDFMTVLTSTPGKIYAILFACCGLMFNMLASRLRRRNRLIEKAVADGKAKEEKEEKEEKEG